MSIPTTIEELLEQSKQFHNYNKYSPEDWVYIARFITWRTNILSAYVILNSKHMRWCEDRTFEGFLSYLDDESIDDAEITYLIESAKKHG